MRNTKLLLLIPIIIVIIFLIEMISRNPSSPQPSQFTFATPTTYPTLALTKQVGIPQILTNQANTSYEIDISSLPFSLPAKINIYQVQSREIPDSIIQNVLSTFPALSKDTNQLSFVTTYHSEDKTQELLVTKSGYLTYTNSYTPPKGIEKSIITISQVDAYIADTIKKLGINPSDFRKGSASFAISDGSHASPTESFTEADFIITPFTRVLDSNPVYFQGGTNDSLVIWLDKYGIIRKLTFQYAFIHGYEQTQPPSLATLQANTRKARVVNLDTSVRPTSLKTTSVRVAYLDDRETAFIQPILIIDAEGVLPSQQETIPVIMYLPILSK